MTFFLCAVKFSSYNVYFSKLAKQTNMCRMICIVYFALKKKKAKKKKVYLCMCLHTNAETVSGKKKPLPPNKLPCYSHKLYILCHHYVYFQIKHVCLHSPTLHAL